jgi:hypothetical protein
MKKHEYAQMESYEGFLGKTKVRIRIYKCFYCGNISKRIYRIK